jgi:glutamate-1-semialdehyde 2,1-aminomutase
LRKENHSKRLFQKAQNYLVGGVDSPVRSFRGVGRDNPIFISRAKGSKIYDEDGNCYVDYVCSWGASILGSAHPRVVTAVRSAASRGLSFGAATKGEVKLAEIIQKSVPSLELMRFVSSGTEATMSAARLARAFTSRDKIVKFDGCYHGHSDQFLVKAGSGLATFSMADSAGVPGQLASDTLVAAYNDLDSVRAVFSQNRDEVAAVIVEPVAGNMGVVPPAEGFLEGLREVCDASGAVLIFDEVITGFRLGSGGAQSMYGVKPDLTCLGKVIGGGMNIAAFGGRKEIMDLLAPLGPVYQAGTLAGNPVAVASGIATLETLLRGRNAFTNLDKTSADLARGLEEAAQGAGVRVRIQRIGSMIGLFFLLKNDDDDGKEKEDASYSSPLLNYEQIRNLCDGEAYSRFFGSMLESGVYLPPSAFETIFVSTAHSARDVSATVRSARHAFEELSRKKREI